MFFIKSSGTHLREHKGHKEMSLANKPLEFLNPEYVYIPLVEQNTVCEAIVAVGDTVKVGQVIANKVGRFGLPVHSPVSGEVVAVDKKMWHSSGKMVNTIQIKNDFLETKVETIKATNPASLSKAEMIEMVKQNGIVGLGGSGFPSFVKYQLEEQVDYFIVNAVECEPYITVDYMLLMNDFDKVIRGMKYIMGIIGAPKGVIALKKKWKDLINHLQEQLEEEDSIELFLVKDEYPAGWEKYIVQRVTKKNYVSLPCEAGAVVNNSSTVAAVADAIEYNQPLVEKVVTITGEAVNTPTNLKVKIGTSIADILDKVGGYVEDLEDAYFIAGGPMTGTSIMFDSLVVNRSLGSVIVMPKDIKELNPECMGCGKCADVCPVFLSPIIIKETLEADNLNELKALRPNLCIECGLCSYICPSRIELTDAVAKAKKKVMV